MRIWYQKLRHPLGKQIFPSLQILTTEINQININGLWRKKNIQYTCMCYNIKGQGHNLFDFWLVKLIRFYYNPVVDLK